MPPAVDSGASAKCRRTIITLKLTPRRLEHDDMLGLAKFDQLGILLKFSY